MEIELNDFDLIYNFDCHGWSTCHLLMNNEVIRFDITHIFNNPISEIIDSAIKLLKKENYVSFLWFEEPGTIQWNIERLKKEQHKAKFKITEFESMGEVRPNSKIFKEYEFEYKIDYFIKIVYIQMEKIFLLLKDKSYRSNRSNDFDIRQFLELKSLMEL